MEIALVSTLFMFTTSVKENWNLKMVSMESKIKRFEGSFTKFVISMILKFLKSPCKLYSSNKQTNKQTNKQADWNKQIKNYLAINKISLISKTVDPHLLNFVQWENLYHYKIKLEKELTCKVKIYFYHN